MLEYKYFLGGLSVIVGLAGYVPYFKDIMRNSTKPHLFSWIIWTIIQCVAFFAAISKGGGAGTWFVGAAAIACLAVSLTALFKGEKNITKTDWVSFLAALVAIVVWVFTSEPLWAVIIVSIADCLGFVPTFTKTFHKPLEETLSNYVLAATANAMALSALEAYSPTTYLYPATLVASNSVFVIMALSRRRQIKYA